MGIFTKVEDRPTPAAVYNWRVYAIAAVAGSAAIMIGYDRLVVLTPLSFWLRDALLPPFANLGKIYNLLMF
jgi:hypothetical protein